MNRRKYLISTFGIGSGLFVWNNSKQPVIAFNIDLGTIPRADPENIDSVSIIFDEISILAKNIYSDEDANITMELNIDNQDIVSKNKTVNLENNEKIDISQYDELSKIESKNINASSDSLEGVIKITVNHPDVTDTFEKSFSIEKPDIKDVSYQDNFDSGELNSVWETYTRGDSSNDYVKEEDEFMKIRMNAGSSAACGDPGSYSELNFGDITQEINISFDWETQASGWYEGAELRIFEDGERTYRQGFSVDRDDTNTGSYSDSINVDGNTTVRLLVRESSYCSASDHNWTEFRIANFEIK